MKKIIYLIIVIIIIVVIGILLRPAPATQISTPADELADPLNAGYNIANQAVFLTNGHAEVQLVPNAASKMIVDVFGQPALGDLNDDGTPDTALILSENSGGTGTFYYVAANITGIGSTNTILLGDRIAPQTIQIKDGILIVNYADRGPDEPMSRPPSVSVSKHLIYQNGILVDQDLSDQL